MTRVYTDLAVIDIEEGHFVRRETLPAISVDDLQPLTGAAMRLPDTIADLTAPEL